MTKQTELYTEFNTIPPHVFFQPDSNRPKQRGPKGNKWSGNSAVPAIGATVRVRINSIGTATVLRYFTEHGYLGVLVQPENPPAWYVKQNGRYSPCHVFGAELAE